MKMFSRSRWIWIAGPKMENQHVCFRSTFEHRPGAETPLLRIAADSDFVAYLNGVRVGQGQFSDWPEEKTYSSFDVSAALRPGKNVLAVLGYYRGRGFSTYALGEPGLIVELGELVSDSGWRCRMHPAFFSGEIAVTTSQLGFSAAFDARSEDRWTETDYDDSGWGDAVETGYPEGYRATLTPRPLPPLRERPELPGTVVMQGRLLRRSEGETFAVSVAADLLTTLSFREAFSSPSEWENRRPELRPPQPGKLTFRPLDDSGLNGYFAVVDLGAEYAGLLTLRLAAPAGTVCDLAVGEHLDDGRVRAKIGYRNFTDRYVCHEGENVFQFPFRRVAGRYVEIHLTGMGAKSVTLDYLGIAPVEPVLPKAAGFSTGDRLTNHRYRIAVRTLELCMHEHYEDCPWREQALYTYDSRNQTLYGYFRWGNYAFARTSIDLLGRGFRPDGLLHLCAPARMDLTIPVFSFVWVPEIAEYELFSGDATLFDHYREQIAAMISAVLARYDEATGLFQPHREEYHWNFCEWTPGLDGQSPAEREGMQAAFNLYFYEMISSYLTMLERRGEGEPELAATRERLGQAIHRRFWDDSARAYASLLIGGEQRQGYHEHIQAVALFLGIVPAELVPVVLDTLKKRTLVPISYSAFSYLIRALMAAGPEARREAELWLQEAFEPLALSGATSLWETPLGSSDFADAGSLCHAWSSADVYFDHAEVLGIKPLEPGFRRFSIAPYPGKHFEAKGSVPTPSGLIEVEWRRRDGGLEFRATGPEGLRPELRPYPEVPLLSVTYNGKKLL